MLFLFCQVSELEERLREKARSSSELSEELAKQVSRGRHWGFEGDGDGVR